METIYRVYFDCYGKKLYKDVLAKTEAHAKTKVLQGIKFDKVKVLGAVTDSQKKNLAKEMFNDIVEGLKIK